MRAWNVFKAGFWRASRYGRIAFIAVMGAMVLDDWSEVVILGTAGGVAAAAYNEIRRKLREAEMLARAWRTDATMQQGLVFAERMENLKLKKRVAELDHGTGN